MHLDTSIFTFYFFIFLSSSLFTVHHLAPPSFSHFSSISPYKSPFSPPFSSTPPPPPLKVAAPPPLLRHHHLHYAAAPPPKFFVFPYFLLLYYVESSFLINISKEIPKPFFLRYYKLKNRTLLLEVGIGILAIDLPSMTALSGGLSITLVCYWIEEFQGTHCDQEKKKSDLDRGKTKVVE
ncbi:uncharacterized protein [Gossypium hirsutum]|uniref:Uncharacterized protein n=1 Tax=Gossypium hirsutum TaxID=3635 RepID=A0ABM3ASW2_GOSHI|nr:uncharacterized protein LOC121221178 [Gossypium hirsutum]